MSNKMAILFRRGIYESDCPQVTSHGIPELLSGDWVEVRSVKEILATLDDRGSLDVLPHMPEMLQYGAGDSASSNRHTRAATPF
jgi:hypothetical protein